MTFDKTVVIINDKGVELFKYIGVNIRHWDKNIYHIFKKGSKGGEQDWDVRIDKGDNISIVTTQEVNGI